MEANQSRRGFLRGALALPAVAALPVISEVSKPLGEGKAIFMIEGETVLVDTADIMLGEGDRSVVVDATGSMKIERSVVNDDEYFPGPRRGIGPLIPAPHMGRGAKTRSNYTIIGKVIEPTSQARITA